MTGPVLVTDAALAHCAACGAYTLTVNLPEQHERRCWPCLDDIGDGPQVPVYDPDDQESDPAYWWRVEQDIAERRGL